MTTPEFFNSDHFAQLCGARVIEQRDGYARAEMPITDTIRNASGWAQGGAVFALADIAFAAAAASHGQLTVTVNANIVFIKSAREGTLTAEAHELFDHKRIPFVEVRVTDDQGELIAHLTATGYRKSSSTSSVQ